MPGASVKQIERSLVCLLVVLSPTFDKMYVYRV